MKRVLVTGATGFVGAILCDVLRGRGYTVRAATRVDGALPAFDGEAVVVGDIGANTNWRDALAGVDLIVHTAARAHVLNVAASNSDAYVETNARGTRRLAVCAAESGTRRFVYLSSVKVNGEETTSRPYTPQDLPAPRDSYGTSKWLGEKYLLDVVAQSGMEAAIVRSPLVYGPGVRANFLRLLHWIDRGRPLPFGAVRNRRSLVSVWNLCDLLTQVLTHSLAPGRTWMVSDGDDLSTPELIQRIAAAMNRRVSMPRIPVALMRTCGVMAGRSALINRICGSLTVDITQTRRELGWSPPLSVDEALARTVSWYLSERRLRGGVIAGSPRQT
jgi:nucleoside-diphosphate-sugar epimerase